MTPIINNMISKRSGRPVANQFIVNTGDSIFMQSYNRICVEIDNRGHVWVTKWYDYSRTTWKYVKQFLNDHGFKVDSLAEMRKKIEVHDGVVKCHDICTTAYHPSDAYKK